MKREPGELPDFAQVREFLFGLRNRGSKFGIERMVRFAAAAGNPERSFPVIHVAGTNGKGSVCALLEAALREAGFRTGLFTSPHLVHLGERVQVDRVPMTEREIAGMTSELREVAAAAGMEESEGEYPSFFEFMTLMAFRRFAAEAVDCALIEVGLGGRLDSTNIVVPEVSIITSIGLDHQEILGDTLGAIAGEKAGICKPGVPLVLGKVCEEAKAVILERAEDLGCPVYSVEERFREEELPVTNLVGNFQRWNAGVALLALALVRGRFPVEDVVVRRAFQKTVWSGRWEKRVIGGVPFIFDATHNPQGAEELASNLCSCFSNTKGALDVIVGSLGKARAEAVLRIVAPYARRIFIVRPNQPKALPFEEMRQLVPDDFCGEVVESTVGELFPGGERTSLAPGSCPVLLTGSLYLIGEVYSQLEQESAGATGALQDRF